MAKFNGFILTEKGRELLAKGLSGETITFTKMAIGDGSTTTNVREMEALANQITTLPILNINAKKNGTCEINALLTNKSVTTGFYIKELGIFAHGDDNVEILYAYNVSTSPDFVPPFSANNVVEIEYVDTIIVDQVANVTAVIDPSITYITKKYADENYLVSSRLAEILGLQFGGNIQDVGNKVKGKFYYDDVTKFYYECLENTDLTYNESSKFRAISNKPISDRLENLWEVTETVNVQNSVFSVVRFWRYGKKVFLFVFFDYKNSNVVNWLTEGITLTNFPVNFIPDTNFIDTEHIIVSNNNKNQNITRLVLRKDKITIHGVENMTHYEIKGIISYIAK